MRQLFCILTATFMLALPFGLQAQERPVVVELFTSQGCSSCPPADALLHDLAQRDDVIALAMHVDYWDYIGWKDSFATPALTQRQRDYARAGGRRMVYTPQMIINGQDHVVGTRVQDVHDLIARHERQAPVMALEARREGDEMTIRATPARDVTGPLTVQLLRYRPSETVAIKRGENAGQTLNYTHVVTQIDVLREWDGRGVLEVTAEVSGALPAVVMVQGADHGPVLAAAYVE